MTKIWAHRGASGDYADNSMTAFTKASDQGADGIELDVQKTADGHLVIYHDENLVNLTGRRQWLCEQTLAQVQAYPLGPDTDDRVPLLTDFLDWFKTTDLTLNLEIKNGAIPIRGIEEELLVLVKDYQLLDRVIFSSFNHPSVKLLKELDPEARCAILYSAQLYRPWDYAKALNVDGLHPMRSNLLAEDLVEVCHLNKLKIAFWTLNEPEEMALAFKQGADAIITNYPIRASRLREQMSPKKGEGGQDEVRL